MLSLEEARSRTDATLLRGDCSAEEMRIWAERMHDLNPRTVCVYPAYLHLLLDLFPSPATVIAFPHGADTTRAKMLAMEDALQTGAGEIDIVAPLRYIQSGEWTELQKEIKELLRIDKKLKLILETSLWDTATVERAAREAVDAGALVLKTSTGMQGGASKAAVRALARSGAQEIKASGGIRSLQIANEMKNSGATIFGSSNIEDWS